LKGKGARSKSKQEVYKPTKAELELEDALMGEMRENWTSP
jgi:hypothetical protein